MTGTDAAVMLRSAVSAMLRRELGSLRRSLEAYPDENNIWAERPGVANTGGTLVLHVAGNLQHYLGAVLGGSGYQRDRDAEFALRAVPRATLLNEIEAAEMAVARGIAALDDSRLGDPYPELVAGRQVTIGDFLLHLVAHLSYHLGQIDYHRRIVTGDGRTVGAVAPAELPDRDRAAAH